VLLFEKILTLLIIISFSPLCCIRFAQLKASMAHFKHMWLPEFNPKPVRSVSTPSNLFHSIKELTLLITTGRTKERTVYFILLFFFLVDWSLNSDLCFQSRPSATWTTPPVHFALIILETRVLWTVYPCWPQTVILLISASQVVSITVVSHWHLVESSLFLLYY
jgi:hypothetical protein